MYNTQGTDIPPTLTQSKRMTVRAWIMIPSSHGIWSPNTPFGTISSFPIFLLSQNTLILTRVGVYTLRHILQTEVLHSFDSKKNSAFLTGIFEIPTVVTHHSHLSQAPILQQNVLESLLETSFLDKPLSSIYVLLITNHGPS